MKTFFLLTAFLFFSFSFSQTKHIGEWRGTDKEGKTKSIILDDTGHAALVSEGVTIGGAEFETGAAGVKGEMKYEINYSANPITLDLVMYIKGHGEEQARFMGIVRFLSDTKMEVRMAFDGERFTEFDTNDKKASIILEKVK